MGASRRWRVTDLSIVVHEAEEVREQITGKGSAEAVATRERMRARPLQARDGWMELQQNAVARAKVAGRKADDGVHARPWPAIGAVAGVGVPAGLLIGCR